METVFQWCLDKSWFLFSCGEWWQIHSEIIFRQFHLIVNTMNWGSHNTREKKQYFWVSVQTTQANQYSSTTVSFCNNLDSFKSLVLNKQTFMAGGGGVHTQLLHLSFLQAWWSITWHCNMVESFSRFIDLFVPSCCFRHISLATDSVAST